MSSSSDLVPVREKIPYTGKGLESLLGMLRRILTDNPYTQEIFCRIGQPIEIVKLVPADSVQPKISLHDAVRGKRMEEYVPEEKTTPWKTLWGMFSAIAEEGLQVSHVAVGDKYVFQKWLGVRIPQNKMSFYGTQIVLMPELPPDVFLVIGGDDRNGEPESVQMALKGTIES